MWKMSGAVFAASLAGCAAHPDRAFPQACVAEVRSFANPEAGSRGDFSANVMFSDVQISAFDVGYGATAGRRDEITLSDGVLHLARPEGARTYRQRLRADAGEGAYMLQVVKVQAWRADVTLPAILSLDGLGAAIADQVRSIGCAGEAKLAYRIVGRAKRAEWSLDTLPARGDYVSEGDAVIVAGLFATKDQGRHFVPEGRNIHAHAVFPSLDVAGHLKALELEPGARLQIQAR